MGIIVCNMWPSICHPKPKHCISGFSNFTGERFLSCTLCNVIIVWMNQNISMKMTPWDLSKLAKLHYVSFLLELLSFVLVPDMRFGVVCRVIFMPFDYAKTLYRELQLDTAFWHRSWRPCCMHPKNTVSEHMRSFGICDHYQLVNLMHSVNMLWGHTTSSGAKNDHSEPQPLWLLWNFVGPFIYMWKEKRQFLSRCDITFPRYMSSNTYWLKQDTLSSCRSR